MWVEGKLLSIERSNGSFSDAGRDIVYDNTIYRVLESDRIRLVKIKTTDPQPNCVVGDTVRFEVNVGDNFKLDYRSQVAIDSKAAPASPLHKVG